MRVSERVFKVLLGLHLSDVVFVVGVVTRHIGRHLELGLHAPRLRLRSAEAVGIVVRSAA